jgi:hypothetical protein
MNLGMRSHSIRQIKTATRLHSGMAVGLSRSTSRFTRSCYGHHITLAVRSVLIECKTRLVHQVAKYAAF